jgi:Family of unknown function (DUF6082)
VKLTRSSNRRGSRIILVVLWCGFVALIVLLIGISPLALQQLAHIHGLDWVQLSNIGQAYGAAVALLTVLTLGGVVAALIVQLRDSRATREQTARSFHLELLRMAMEQEDFREVMGVTSADSRQERQIIYARLWVAYWLMLYRIDYLSEAELRLNLSREIFQSIPGRTMWEGSRDFYLTTASQDRRSRTFYEIVNDEYARLAPLMPHKVVGRSVDPCLPGRNPLAKQVGAAILAAATLAALGRLIRCNNRESRH